MAACDVSVERPAPVLPNDEHAVTNADSSDAAAGGSQNGVAVSQTDRFGFCGGHQYTDPSRYVSLFYLRLGLYAAYEMNFIFNPLILMRL